jgi:hypothetical protein
MEHARTLPKYKQNLSIVEKDGERFVRSYNTLVARIEDGTLYQLGWWSVTTQKHINYVAKHFGYQIVKP